MPGCKNCFLKKQVQQGFYGQKQNDECILYVAPLCIVRGQLSLSRCPLRQHSLGWKLIGNMDAHSAFSWRSRVVCRSCLCQCASTPTHDACAGPTSWARHVAGQWCTARGGYVRGCTSWAGRGGSPVSKPIHSEDKYNTLQDPSVLMFAIVKLKSPDSLTNAVGNKTYDNVYRWKWHQYK